MNYLNDPLTDIDVPNGKTVAMKTSYTPLTKDDLKLKTKMAAWLVSNCRPISQRKNYVTELAKYINVDIYGGCGDLKCQKGSACMEKTIQPKYKFYLAFENSMCKDYITEKAWNTLTYDIVPVVLGGGNYTKYLPPHSFIDVRDYESPFHLAQYLKYLDSNPKEYVRYFAWKANYVIQCLGDQRGMCHICDLCAIIYDDKYKFKSGFSFTDYWNAARQCISGNQERKILGL